MRYTKQMIGEMLKSELKQGYDLDKISHWANKLIIHTGNSESEDDVFDILEMLVGIELPEFEYSEEELHEIAEKLCSGENPFK